MSTNENNLLVKKEYLRKRYLRYYTWIGPLLSKPRTRAYTFLALSLFCAAFFLFFAIRPTINTIAGLRKQIDDEKLVEKKLQDKINALSQIQAEYSVIQSYLPALNSSLPTKADVVDLVKSIEKLANENQASLSAVQIGETFLDDKTVAAINTPVVNVKKNNENAQQTFASATLVSFVFTVEGDYSNAANLVAKVGRLPRLLTTQNVLLTKGVGKVIATVRLSAYYLPISQ
ncbi:type 4a pilus biogenesis protein PilO [Candidatus Gottesmanbacteria bacterium]|nr:type 4a pilus biogenesis protein PilO [Candidatus Gottesmanbacteria bacterium]